VFLKAKEDFSKIKQVNIEAHFKEIETESYIALHLEG
jgi:hypothetical protein